MTPTDFVPDWAKGIVWYQIFPERFWNGDPGNDPRLEDQAGAWPHDQSPPWQIHPWTADWYELQPYERANGQSLWHNLQRRRYGGDLQGIIDRLDYLQDLDVDALYLNPVFSAPSSHKYDGAAYHHVDPTFGPDPEGDRALMAQENPADPATWVWTAADKLLHLRNNTPALRRGDFSTVMGDAAEVYAFRRQHEGQTVLVALNRSEETQEIRLPTGPASRYLDLLNGGQELLAQEGALTVELSPLWGRILQAV